MRHTPAEFYLAESEASLDHFETAGTKVDWLLFQIISAGEGLLPLTAAIAPFVFRVLVPYRDNGKKDTFLVIAVTFFVIVVTYHAITVRGFVYDMTSGRLREIQDF
jgi:hypothetical protein